MRIRHLSPQPGAVVPGRPPWWRRLWSGRRAATGVGVLATDALTGLPDREGTLAQATALQVRARQCGAGLPLGLLLAELDDTPHLVATHGVGLAESAVHELSMALRQGLRQGDLLGRFAAGAFLIVLPPTDPAHLRMVGERVRAQVQRCTLRDGASGAVVPLSLHVGATAAPLDEPLGQALARAEMALQCAAPRGGRGERVSVVLR